MSSNPEEFDVNLSRNEMIALVKYHAAKMREVPKRLGKALLSSGRPVPGWAAKKATQEATNFVSAHQQRARSLLSQIGALPKKD
jgi:hypothetical protein